MDSLRSLLVKITPSTAAAAASTSLLFRSTSRSLQSLSSSSFLLHYQCDLSSHNVNVLSVRNLHFSRQLTSPRFKLNVPKPPLPKSELGEKEEEEEEENEKKQGYLKSHPYRRLLNNYKSKSELAQFLVDNVIYSDRKLSSLLV